MHTPVLLNEVEKILDLKPGEFFIDGTIGNAGHSLVILEKIAPEGKLLGVDWDEATIKKLKIERLKDFRNVILVQDNYADLPEILKERNLGRADGLLLDLGMSSDQLENSGRGFSYLKDEPLLMTYDSSRKPVKEILRDLREEDLAKIIKDFSQERFAYRIAKAIKRQGRIKPIESSKELAEIITNAVPGHYERGRLHPATRTFMALRIFANKELENLESILKNLDKILKPKGRAAIISFHSLEDRLVKNYFREMEKSGIAKILTKKPIRATEEEIRQNPRCRSAKLRVAVKIGE